MRDVHWSPREDAVRTRRDAMPGFAGSPVVGRRACGFARARRELALHASTGRSVRTYLLVRGDASDAT